MILQDIKRDSVVSGEQIQTGKMNISADVESHVIRILTEYAYSAPLASLIREQISNSLDSQEKAGNPDPVILRLVKNQVNQWQLEFIDEGLGLDDFNFQKYIMGIGESTKRDDPTQRGGYGAGGKSPLAYTNSYSYTCRKDGIERKYLIFKGESVPESTLLYETPTDERDGVKVEVVIKNEDYKDAILAIRQQCSYMAGVHFDVPGLNINYSIYKSDLFLWNDLGNFSEMHISLKGVYYPINWSKLGIPRLYMPIGLRFDNYDGIRPTFNREDIEWNKESIQKVKEQIKAVSNYFIKEYNKTVETEYESILEVWEDINHPRYQVEIADTIFKVKELEPHSDFKLEEFKVKGIKHIPLSTYKQLSTTLLDDLYSISNLTWNGMNKSSIGLHHFNNYQSKSSKLVLIDYRLSGYILKHLKEKYRKDTTFCRWKDKSKKIGYIREIRKYTDRYFPYTKESFQEYLNIRESVQKQLIIDETKLEDTLAYQKWVEEEREKNKSKREYTSKKLEKTKEDIVLSIARNPLIGHRAVLEKKAFNPDKLLCWNSVFVYGAPEDKELIQDYFDLFEKPVVLCTISKQELAKIKGKLKKKFINIHQMTQDFKPFGRL